MKILEDDYYIAHDGCWLTVGTGSIRIHPTPEGISIEVYHLGRADYPVVRDVFVDWSELEIDNMEITS